MPPPSSPLAVKDFFSRNLRLCFEDLDIADDVGLADYLAGVLAHYSHQEAMHPAGGDGVPLVTFGDRLRAIQVAWTPGPRFEPEREVDLRRDLGEYALFLQGFFREHVRATSTRAHWLRQGRRAYRFLAEYHRALERPEARLYAALATRFDTYAAVISYMRDVHLGGEFGPSPRTVPAPFIVP